jgi:hypothetical protein
MEKSENVGSEPKMRYHSYATRSELWPQGVYKVLHGYHVMIEYSYKTKALTITDPSKGEPHKTGWGWKRNPPTWRATKWHLNMWLPLGFKVLARPGTSNRFLYMPGKEKPIKFWDSVTVKYRGIL